MLGAAPGSAPFDCRSPRAVAWVAIAAAHAALLWVMAAMHYARPEAPQAAVLMLQAVGATATDMGRVATGAPPQPEPPLARMPPAVPRRPADPRGAATVAPAMPVAQLTPLAITPAPASSPQTADASGSVAAAATSATGPTGSSRPAGAGAGADTDEASESERAAVPAVPPVLSPPRFDAGYLHNPAPDYPVLSQRLGEQGRVLLRVHVSAEGQAQEVLLQQSCGHARLDEAARRAVQRWRFVPARLGTLAVAAWVVVPIRFAPA